MVDLKISGVSQVEQGELGRSCVYESFEFRWYYYAAAVLRGCFGRSARNLGWNRPSLWSGWHYYSTTQAHVLHSTFRSDQHRPRIVPRIVCGTYLPVCTPCPSCSHLVPFTARDNRLPGVPLSSSISDRDRKACAELDY